LDIAGLIWCSVCCNNRYYCFIASLLHLYRFREGDRGPHQPSALKQPKLWFCHLRRPQICWACTRSDGKCFANSLHEMV